ncbi:MAG: ANTAR domain protein with unknown sensor [uncultured Nocardioidaceae bacterium]|uniref:ANTAR domain-containing protein n=1 Tax=uncultured Nocardioidaceae bacterium TaxID=253824 RepID=A0A6J4KYS3_9ACTN|nr:MAG: ANTAR domain protein with unknown sensor [uncultured Nocardioidaceae bacterium]
MRRPVDEPSAEQLRTGPALAAALADLALRLAEAPTLAETERRVVEHAVRLVGGDHAGLHVLRGRRGVELSTATDEALLRRLVTDAAGGAATGPEVAVLGEDDLVVVGDTALDRRWPEWSARAGGAGVRSALAVRVATLGPVHGSLVVTAASVSAFAAPGTVERARLLAVHAATALVAAQQQENLWQAVDARKLIGQAQGMLMERFDLDTEQAFAVLLRYSQDHNRKLRSVAEQLVDERALPD